MINKLPLLVSVCCITYNHERFIGDAIEGFLMQQTSFGVEIIIHDDASTDKTQDIIRDYAEKYPDKIIPILQNENKYSAGVSLFKEFVFPVVRGKYIALCEGDDFWIDPEKLQQQVDFLESNPEYAFCFHSAKILHNDSYDEEDSRYKSLGDKEYKAGDIIRRLIIPTASVVFRAEYIPYINDRIKASPDYFFYDIVLFLLLAGKGRIRCFNRAMSVYRIYGGGMHQTVDTNYGTKFYRHYLAINKAFRGIYNKEIMPHLVNHAFIACKLHLNAGRYYHASMYFFRFLKHLIMIIIYDPGRIVGKAIKVFARTIMHNLKTLYVRCCKYLKLIVS